jgi:acyl-[acyl carrier protein]--UDP-N-acetylglucosamine O-acyltransferase
VIEIHPTAIVEKGAKLGKGCVVGPGAIVGGEVELGEGCVVGPKAVLEGRVVMGEESDWGGGSDRGRAARHRISGCEVGSDGG